MYTYTAHEEKRSIVGKYNHGRKYNNKLPCFAYDSEKHSFSLKTQKHIKFRY